MIRHGPMVFGICNRVLQDAHDAQDAFQAVFLVLANRVAINWPERLGRKLAVRGDRTRRRTSEKPSGTPPSD